MGTVKSATKLWPALMQDTSRRTLGYAAVGLVVGLFLFPWVFMWTVRSGMATLGNPVWATLYFAVILVPGLIFALMAPKGDRFAP